MWWNNSNALPAELLILWGKTDVKRVCILLWHGICPAPKKGKPFKKWLWPRRFPNWWRAKTYWSAAAAIRLRRLFGFSRQKRKNCVLVIQKKKLVGILSYRDLLLKVAMKHKDISKVKAEDVMTPNPEYVKPEDPIAYVVNKMSMGGFRHIPVLSTDDTPLSIISIKDVLRYLGRRGWRALNNILSTSYL